MVSKIIRTETPEEREFAAKKTHLAALETQLAQRELDLATLRAELNAFEQRYLRAVGVRFAEIDDLEAQIAETLKGRNPFDETARQRAAEARKKADEASRVVDSIEPSAQAAEFKPSEDLKRLYREIAKRIHPDLATDDAERVKRNEVMAEINRAYATGDEARLRAIFSEWETSPDGVTGDGIGAELIRTIRKIHQVDGRLGRIEAEIAELSRSELSMVKARLDSGQLNGPDLLAHMAEELDAQILQLRQRREELANEAS